MFRWAVSMAAAIVAPMTAAVPFEVEITIPDISGAIFSGDPDVPNTLFTVPYVVVRATGDTANAIYEAPLNSTYASKVIAEIPGIGRAEMFGGGGSVSVRSGDVDIASPEFPTVFDMGIRAMFDTVPGYNMQASLGPIALHDAFTYHWGPTSSMIPFTLDNGKVGTFRGGAKEGATLKVTIGGNAPNPVAARVYRDIGAFLQATGPNRVATFEEGSGSASGGVAFAGNLLQVIESVTESGTTVKTHANWFAASGSPTHFAVDPVGSPTQPTNRIEATFPEPVLAVGFLYNCFECNESPLQHGFVWTTRDADGTAIETGTTVVDEPTPAGVLAPRPGFFGLTTTKPFRHLSVLRVHPFNAFQRWVYDDVRYATTLPAVEYHHAGFDHYFVTSLTDELTKLDEGTFTGWARTGLSFNVAAPGAAGTNPVCRLFSASFAPKSSHFYSSDPAECELRKADPHWQFEGNVFSLGTTDAGGGCAAGTTALYRLYNNGQGGVPNHRYTTSATARQAMIDAGWIPEGAGALGVIGCVSP
jgi:hypothetical protein